MKNVRDINDYVNDIFSNNINKTRETNNKFKSKSFRTIVDYVVKNYRKKSIFFERIIKIENHSITQFLNYIRQKILNENRCFKCLKKEHRFTKDDASCKHQSIMSKEMSKDETILKLTTIDIV